MRKLNTRKCELRKCTFLGVNDASGVQQRFPARSPAANTLAFVQAAFDLVGLNSRSTHSDVAGIGVGQSTRCAIRSQVMEDAQFPSPHFTSVRGCSSKRVVRDISGSRRSWSRTFLSTSKSCTIFGATIRRFTDTCIHMLVVSRWGYSLGC